MVSDSICEHMLISMEIARSRWLNVLEIMFWQITILIDQSRVKKKAATQSRSYSDIYFVDVTFSFLVVSLEMIDI